MKMTKYQVLKQFRAEIAPMVREQFGRDSIAMREAFNDYTDALCKDGSITSRQYNTWSNPY